LPLWRRTKRIIKTLVMIRKIESAKAMRKTPLEVGVQDTRMDRKALN
jgi:hypothetical protein